jgi:large repetitive protein
VVQVGPLPVGSHVFELTVSDGTLSSSDTVTITVLPPPTISIADVAVVEGDHGVTPATFVVTLSRALAQTVTVQYATAPGTAQSPKDYVSTSGLLSFPAGVTTRTLQVSVNGDRKCEDDETFSVQLSQPVGATLADAVGVGTILNDDCGPH